MPDRPIPSQLIIDKAGPAPFINCFGRFESEVCAAIYVEACLDRGDAFQKISQEQFFETFEKLIKAEKTIPWIRFAVEFRYNINPMDLINDGFFSLIDYEHLETTDKFFETVEAKGFVRR